MKWIGGALVATMMGCGGNKAATEDVVVVPDTTAKTDAATIGQEDPNAKRVRIATASLAAGRKAYDERDYARAILEAQRGFDALGQDYRKPNVEDDSELKLAAARERNGQDGGAADAATIFLRILNERLEMARSKWNILF